MTSTGTPQTARVKALPPVELDDKIYDIVDAAGARKMMPALAAIEMCAWVDMNIIQNMGTACDEVHNQLLQDCTTAAEKAEWVKAYAKAMIAKDPGLHRSILEEVGQEVEDDAKASEVMVMRAIRALHRGIENSNKKGATAGSEVKPKITVVTSPDDEDAYINELDGTEMDQQNAKMETIYGRRIHAGLIAKIAVLKRISYAVVIENTFASAQRVKIKTIMASPRDSAFYTFKRWIAGHMLIAAGANPPNENQESNGHGWVTCAPSLGQQWLSWHDCMDLLDVIESNMTGISEESMWAIVDSIITLLHFATASGHPRATGSAAVAGVQTDVLRMLMAAKAAAVSVPTKRKIDDDDEPPRGPNGLVRMKGGNPEGAPCKDFVKGKCPRSLCSFSHKKRKVKSTPASPGEGDEPEE
jgi:hypothetical protein